jgi:hypothetical protein
VHFTNAGAEEVARIASDALCPFLARRFPPHVTGSCGQAAS